MKQLKVSCSVSRRFFKLSVFVHALGEGLLFSHIPNSPYPLTVLSDHDGVLAYSLIHIFKTLTPFNLFVNTVYFCDNVSLNFTVCRFSKKKVSLSS